MSAAFASLPGLVRAHLGLTLAALVVAVGCSVPLGIMAARRPRLAKLLLGVAGVVQTIPGLALLAVMVPLLAAVGAPAIGFLPAFLALVLYGVLPVLQNTVTGLTGVDPLVVDAARGVGMDARQSLRRVELPLALPMIVAGVRTATVWLVGLATLATPVGATSLGNLIFSGLQTRNFAAVLAGCVGAAGLAILLDAVVRVLERGVRLRRRGLVLLAGGALSVLGVWSAAPLVVAGPGGVRPVLIGAKTFTEQYVLAELLAARIGRTGLPTRIVASLGSTVAFDALRSGAIDVYVDYSGTIWSTVMGRSPVHAARADVLAGVREWLLATHGITVAAALGFENTYALAARGPDAARLGLVRIGDLTAHARGFVIGGDYEFFARPEWQAVRSAYDLHFASERSMDPSLMYQAVEQGTVDVVAAFSTDGRLAVTNLRVLADDRGAIPPYDAIVLVGKDLAAARPEAVARLRALDGAIDAEAMRQANWRVDGGGETPAAVAASLGGGGVP